MIVAIRGGVGGEPTTSEEAWSACFDALRRSNDRIEDAESRKILVSLGVAWAKAAYLMERAALLQGGPR